MEIPENFIKNVITEVQYIKDLSFENPGAPMTLIQDEQPILNIQIMVDVKRLEESTFEVVTKYLVTAHADGDQEQVIFVITLDYAGVFTINDVPEEIQRTLLKNYCPAILFPFARSIIANVAREAGLPTIMLQPIDFSQLSMIKEDGNIH